VHCLYGKLKLVELDYVILDCLNLLSQMINTYICSLRILLALAAAHALVGV
jgi:hypothetical protein